MIGECEFSLIGQELIGLQFFHVEKRSKEKHYAYVHCKIFMIQEKEKENELCIPLPSILEQIFFSQYSTNLFTLNRFVEEFDF